MDELIRQIQEFVEKHWPKNAPEIHSDAEPLKTLYDFFVAHVPDPEQSDA